MLREKKEEEYLFVWRTEQMLKSQKNMILFCNSEKMLKIFQVSPELHQRNRKLLNGTNC